MIEGLKVTVDGRELVKLCMKRSEYHAERAEVYRDQVTGMREQQIEGMHYSNGDPIKALEDRKLQHENESKEMLFIADHINMEETYLLNRDDLTRLGIVSSRY